jgi:hypothetical protein
MLREYIISEAMFSLGIPTTRSLAVVTTGEQVFRETPLQGAVLTRVAASHIRVGTFEHLAARGGVEVIRALVEYTLRRHYPERVGDENPCLALLCGVMERQASLVAQWLHVGFIHGVMNTDNMALSGETIDYGPCAFMDSYDPATVFSSIDRDGRLKVQCRGTSTDRISPYPILTNILSAHQAVDAIMVRIDNNRSRRKAFLAINTVAVRSCVRINILYILLNALSSQS